jgi:hypothetical protein
MVPTRTPRRGQKVDRQLGQVKNPSTDDIACWFIDTDYNGESFFWSSQMD